MLSSWLGKMLVPSSWSEEHLLIYKRRQFCDDKQASVVRVNFKLIVRCLKKFFVECSRFSQEIVTLEAVLDHLGVNECPLAILNGFNIL